MRFFIALEIPEVSEAELENVQQHLKEIVPEAKLTDRNKLHLTIAFIGEQPDELQKDITRVIHNATRGISPFKITPAYIDGFPTLHNPHTLWVGVKGDIDKLMVISERIKDGLADLGLDSDERRYIPHIALAKTPRDFYLQQPQKERLQQYMLANSFAPIKITSIKLFESIPEEGFHTHNTLAEVPLVSL